MCEEDVFICEKCGYTSNDFEEFVLEENVDGVIALCKSDCDKW